MNATYLVKLSRPGARARFIYREIPAQDDELALSLARDYLTVVECANVEAIYRLVDFDNEN